MTRRQGEQRDELSAQLDDVIKEAVEQGAQLVELSAQLDELRGVVELMIAIQRQAIGGAPGELLGQLAEQLERQRQEAP